MLELKPQYFGHLTRRADSLEKTLMVGKIEGRRRRGLAEDEMVGWNHWLSGHEFEQTPGDGEGQGSLVCCSPWGHKESDTTEWLNNNSSKERSCGYSQWPARHWAHQNPRQWAWGVSAPVESSDDGSLGWEFDWNFLRDSKLEAPN